MKRTTLLPLAALTFLPLLAAQDKPKDWLPPQLSEQGKEDPRKQLEKAFQKVERKLEHRSLLLLEASKGDTSRLTGAGASGIEELLKMAQQQGSQSSGGLSDLLQASGQEGRQVLEGIDEILKIAKENGNPNGLWPNGGNGAGSASDQQKPQSQSESQQQTESGQKQEQGQEKPDGQKNPSQQDSQPKSNQQDDPNGQKPLQPGKNAPGADELGQAQPVLPGRESWGNLPIHVRDIFRADGSGDMPARYRRWIDSYYRRLNQVNQRQ